MAVSYTHLDVYKRQNTYCTLLSSKVNLFTYLSTNVLHTARNKKSLLLDFLTLFAITKFCIQINNLKLVIK